jgi:hypothetical protein
MRFQNRATSDSQNAIFKIALLQAAGMRFQNRATLDSRNAISKSRYFIRNNSILAMRINA